MQDLQANQDYKGSLQKTHWHSRTSSMITADHKVLSDNCESRNNHRYAVVVQDLATQWIQPDPCKNKTSHETQRSLQKFLEPERKPKVIYTDNSLEFGKACEVLSWNHCTSTPHRSETNGITERAVRSVTEGTSAVLLQSGLEVLTPMKGEKFKFPIADGTVKLSGTTQMMLKQEMISCHRYMFL